MPDWDKDDDFGTMDQLDYQYFDGSNRLSSVTDGISKNDTSGKGEFVDGNKDGDDYVYDPNGNMTQDLNKGIKGATLAEKGIEYNHLNLPTKVSIDDGGANKGTISYIYDATGVKLRKNVLKQGETTPTATDYAGNYIYENNKLQFFSHAEGTVSPKDINDYSAGFDYVYNYTDHLGNIRLSYTDANGDGNITTNEIVKESNYYPFGLSHKGYNNNVSSLGNSAAKKYMFGGKESQDELGLGWYDVTARNYDPALGRWMNLDPLAEQMRRHSPYNFGFNNPIYFQDYDGMMPQGPCGDKPCPKIPKAPRVDVESSMNSVAGVSLVIALIDGPEVGPADGAALMAFFAGAALVTGIDAALEVSNILIDSVNNMTEGEEASSSSEEASSSSEEATTSKTKKERVETESDLEAAINQNEGLMEAEAAAKKEVKGEKQNKIKNVKSQQRENHQLKRIDIDDIID